MGNYFESEEFNEILASYEGQIARGESPYFDADDFADIADNYLTLDRANDAMDAIERGLYVHPDDVVLLTTKCGVLIYLHRYEEARELIRLYKMNSSESSYQKAQLVYAIDYDREKADQMFRAWMENELQNSSEKEKEEVDRESYAHIISSFVELHPNSLENEEDLVYIRKWIEEYMEKFSPLGKYECDITITDICRNNNLSDLLVKGLSQILDEQPYLKNGWSTLAIAYFTLENYEQAIEASDFALAVDAHDLDALLTRAYCYHYLNQKEDAIGYFERYWAEPNKDLVQGIPYGDCLLSCGKPEMAYEMLKIGEEALEAEVKDKPKDALTEDQKKRFVQAGLDAVSAYQQLDKMEDAEWMMQRVIDFNPDAPEFYFMLGNIQLVLGKMDETMVNYSQYLMLSQDRLAATIDIALSMAMNGHSATAVEMLDMVDSLAKTSPESNCVKVVPAIKSLIYLDKGNTDLFLYYFKQSVKLCPDLIENIFKGHFPDDMPIEEYYDYALKKVRDAKNEENSECDKNYNNI